MLSGPRRVVFGLGSNLGDRVGYVRSAVTSLRSLTGVRVVARSSLYETRPVGGPAQGDYINAALLVETDRSAQGLLDAALEIELRNGRVRRERYGPRTLDIDLLWIDGEQVRQEALTVPHARLLERAFALKPLLEVVPDARDPATGRPLSGWLEALDATGMRCVGPAFIFPARRTVGAPLDTHGWKC
jgi:2-amino-4-hydroxy-6-hydroxymethyldihydropteridine diphosphokinase